jgi:hypothetical protein
MCVIYMLNVCFGHVCIHTTTHSTRERERESKSESERNTNNVYEHSQKKKMIHDRDFNICNPLFVVAAVVKRMMLKWVQWINWVLFSFLHFLSLPHPNFIKKKR